MIGLPRTGPLTLETDAGPVFGLLALPAETAWSGTSVLIVGPWGWDDVVTYRSRRDWSDDLTAAGHAVLRLDLPGAGDSAGTAGDDGLVHAWSGAVGAATERLRRLPGCRRVAVTGVAAGVQEQVEGDFG